MQQISCMTTSKIFYSHSNDYIYHNPVNVLQEDYIYCPLELDTEYTHNELLDGEEEFKCTTLTIQVRGISEEKGVIFAHPDNPQPRHQVLKHNVAMLDYLEQHGYKVELTRGQKPDVDMPIFQFDIYAFFAVAELLRLFRGEYRDDVRMLVTNPSNSGIEQGRRLRTYTQCSNQYFNWIEMPKWCLTINGRKFRVRLNIYDTCAVHGNANYASFCSNSGIELKYKDNFTNAEKAHMDVMYLKRPDDFDNYALGDLYNHTALLGNMENFKLIYESLDLEKYFQPSRLTIGSTVSKIIEASIKKLFDVPIDDKDVISRFCKYASADWLKRKTASTACLNAKVDGGRCRNNRPVDTYIKGVLCDIDISGCYGEGLRVQTYPLGIPVVIDYPIKSERNKYQTLRQFLNKYGKELVPGLWQARVSLKDDYELKCKQDYLISWFPPKDISKMPTDTEFEYNEQWWEVDNVGDIKILTNEVNNAIITHDFIQWLDNIASVKQRKELLDNLLIKTAMYYPASERVDSIKRLKEKHKRHRGENTTEARKYRRSTRKISIEHECHAWYGINLGEMFVNTLLLERKKHPKKTPLNNLYKLCINTVYGDMVSPFFKVGNVVVGNNITARARSLAWCMEKGLHGWQAITDGCVFDINKVLYPRKDRRINGEMVVGIYSETNYNNHRLSPLDTFYKIEVKKIKDIQLYNIKDINKPGLIIFDDNNKRTKLNHEDSMEWLNKKAMTHLARLFPGLDILHEATLDIYGKIRIGQFEFEAKGIYDTGTFHGSANYSLSYRDDIKIAMRSYSKKKHIEAKIEDNEVVLSDNYQPAKEFLTGLYNPHNVERSGVFIKNRILKVNGYREHYEKWRETDVYPGCTIEQSGLLHEFSLSQFTFQTYSQYKTWKQEYSRYLRKYGQSYEMFFINEDGTLDYQRMVETIDDLIRTGAKNFFSNSDKRARNTYREYRKHCESECLERVKTLLELRYLGYDIYENIYSDESPQR